MQALILAASLFLATYYGGTSQRIHGSLPAAASAANVTFPLVAPAGSALAPSIAVGNPNTGVFQDPNGSIALTDNGNVILWCNPNQCTAVPTKLQIGGGSSIGDLYFGPMSSSGGRISWSGSNFHFYNGAASPAHAAIYAYSFGGYGSNGAPLFFSLGGPGSTYGLGFADNTHLNLFTNNISALSIDSSQNANFAQPLIVGDGNTIGAKYDKYGNGIPTNPNTLNTYYSDDFLFTAVRPSSPFYNTAGTSGTNFGAGGDVTPNALYSINHPGLIMVATSSTTSSGWVGGGSYQLSKSSTVQYQWRVIFSTPPATSTSTNRYIFYVGAFSLSGTTPYAGPYIEYSDNVNSGNWVLGSGWGGTQSTTNTSTTVSFTSWHELTITLNNGTYTYVLDGTTLGTVVDSNIVSTTWYQAPAGAIGMFGGGTFTAAVQATADKWDMTITGLSR